MQEMLEIIPQIMSHFVPGFIFLLFYRYLIDNEKEEYEYTVIKSIAISYCINLVFSFVDSQFLKMILCLILSVVLPLIFYFAIKKTGVLDRFLRFFTNTSDTQNIWEDSISVKEGSFVSFYLEHNQKNYKISGYVSAFNALEDSCDIAVKEYDIYLYLDEKSPKKIYTEQEKTLVVNSKDVSFIEFK